MRTLIKNANIVTATDQYLADILIEGGKIKAIGQNLETTLSQKPDRLPDRLVDAQGKYVFPGGIDAHTHMELPFMGTKSSDSFESGTLAALHGGTTTIIDFAIQSQGDTLGAALAKWMEMAKGHAVSDYAFHVAVTDFNPKTKAEIQGLIEKDGVTSFKTFMAYKGALMVDDRQMIELFKEVKQHGGLVTTHAENGDIIDSLVQEALARGQTAPKYHAITRPPVAEAEATGRFCDMAYSVQAPCYIVHMTCEDALNRVRQTTERNQKVFVETCVQYLLLDDSLYDSPDLEGFAGSKYVMSPPLRKPSDQAALWAGIRQGLVQTVATDHCPFCMDQKKMGLKAFNKIPNGAPGVEHRMELMFSEGVQKGRMSLSDYVNVTSTQAAKIFGLFPKKGTIAVGSDADLVILDPNVEHTLSAKTHHMNCDYSAYEGWKIKGKIRSTFLRGEHVIDNGVAKVAKGYGQYLRRNKHEQ